MPVQFANDGCEMEGRSKTKQPSIPLKFVGIDQTEVLGGQATE